MEVTRQGGDHCGDVGAREELAPTCRLIWPFALGGFYGFARFVSIGRIEVADGNDLDAGNLQNRGQKGRSAAANAYETDLYGLGVLRIDFTARHGQGSNCGSL